jgi:hypothetical protein
MNYKIVKFYENTGQIEIQCDELPQRISIDLPIDNGKYPEGDDLDRYIRGFIPTWVTTRKERLKKVTNADSIRSLVDSSKETEEEYKKKNFNLRSVYVTRHRLLAESDWTQSTDSPLSDVQKAKWAKYRQELRDITNKPLDHNMVWPTPPKILSIISFVSKDIVNDKIHRP